MTNSPNPDNQPITPANRRRRLPIGSIGVALGVSLLVAFAGGAWWLWIFVHHGLAPLVQKNMIQTLKRPVQLGRVEGFSLTSVQFGPTSIPATAKDPDRASVKAVEATFNPLNVLFTRTLHLDIKLIQPDVYAEQDQQGRWIRTTISPDVKPGPINTALDTVRLSNANVVLVAYPKPNHSRVPFAVKQVDGIAHLLDLKQQFISYELNGQVVNGGSFEVQGESHFKANEHNLHLLGQDLLGADITHLIRVPFDIQVGRVDGDLRVQLSPKLKVPLLAGTANLKAVTAQIERLPQPFSNAIGSLRFQGTQVQLSNVSTSFGKIPLVANGSLDLAANYNLAARVNGVTVDNARETLKIPSPPVKVSGVFRADLRVTGPILNPILSGVAANIKPVRVDRVEFSTARSKFNFPTATAAIALTDIRATPASGGLITGSGKIQLAKTPNTSPNQTLAPPVIDFNLVAQNVPADATAQLYGVSPDVKIGTVSATTQVSGAIGDLQADVNWQAPQAVYPATGRFSLIQAGTSAIAFRDAVINVAGGAVRAAGQYANGRIVASGNADGIELARLVQVPKGIQAPPVSGTFNFSGQSNSETFALQGDGRLNVAGGTVTASSIQVANGQFQAAIRADGVQLGRLAQVPPALQSPLSGNVNLTGSTASFKPEELRVRGVGQLNVAGGTVTASNIQVANGQWQALGDVAGIRVGQLLPFPTPNSEIQTSSLTGQFNLLGSLTALNLANVRGNARGRLNVGDGTVAASVQLGNGQFQTSGTATDIQVGQVLPQLPRQFQGRLVAGQFDLLGSLTALNVANVRGSARGQLNVAGGTVTATNVQLGNGQFQALGTATGIQVGRVLPQLPSQLQGRLVAGQFNLLGSLTAIKPEAIRGDVSGRLQVAGGQVTATNVQLNDGRFRGAFAAEGVQLAPLAQLAALNSRSQLRNASRLNGGNPRTALAPPNSALSTLQVRGRVNGDFTASGPLTAFNPAQIQASGQLSLLDFGTAQLNFDRVLNGDVSVVPGQGVNLRLAGVQDRVEVALSPAYRPVSFFIRHQDAIATGRTQGNLLLVKADNFPVSLVKAFAPPQLPQSIAAQPVSGTVSADLAVNPNTFATEGSVAVAKLKVGPIENAAFEAQFRYANGIGTLANGVLTQVIRRCSDGDLRTRSGCPNGEGTPVTTRYTLAGSFTQTASGPQIKGSVKIAQAQVQNVLTVGLRFFDLENLQQGLQPPKYGKAADVTTIPVGLPQGPVLEQLRDFTAIQVLLAQERLQRRAASPITLLRRLDGSFDGEISFETTPQTGLSATFDLSGRDWKWENYKSNLVLARGSLANGILTLLPLRVESGNSLLAFNGRVGGPQQSGQLVIRNFPLESVQNFVALPVDVTGQLNANAALGGNISNLQAIGDITVAQATLNQKPVESATASFSYNNSRLFFGSNLILTSSSRPIELSGNLPYKLPTAQVTPSDAISLNVDVQNEGLGLLNLVTNQVTWKSGQGQVRLKVGGTLKRPQADGTATINNATISAALLPEPLTDVTGKALFSYDPDADKSLIQVDNIQGKFTRGQVSARGVLPLTPSPNGQVDPAQQLSVTLDKLVLNLKGLYQGGVSGNLAITGSALQPKIGGEVQLSQGQVLLTSALNASSGLSGGSILPNKVIAKTTTSSKEAIARSQIQNPKSKIQNSLALGSSDNTANEFAPELNDLRLILGKSIDVTFPPVLDFQATGSLNVSGPLSDLQPQGRIRLQRGQVNLFTTQFVLARGYEQTATFSPDQGLDPTLNVRLTASVPEITQSRLPTATNLSSSEINQGIDTGISGFETVQVQARVTGPASELSENLELTSSPSRTPAEIVSLLGGGFIDTLGRGNSTLGLANLAGSAVLGNFQGSISKLGNAIGLSELRIYPAYVDTSRVRQRGGSSSLGNSGLALAAEGDIDFTRSLSASITSYLTVTQPTQFGINYRVNNQVRVRASSDFSGDNRAVVEYEGRF